MGQKFKTWGAGEMVQGLRIQTALAEGQRWAPTTTPGGSQLPVTPAAGDPTPSGLCRHSTYLHKPTDRQNNNGDDDDDKKKKNTLDYKRPCLLKRQSTNKRK